MLQGMGPLLVASLLGALVLFVYDLSVTGPPLARPFIAHLPALGWYMANEPDSWRLLESYAAVPISLAIVAVLQLLVVLRDTAMYSALRRR